MMIIRYVDYFIYHWILTYHSNNGNDVCGLQLGIEPKGADIWESLYFFKLFILLIVI